MGNAFDSTNYPDEEPEEVSAGDRWAWKRSDLTEYGAGYTLSYELTIYAGAAPITLTATLSGSEYLIEVGQSTTAGYADGDYQWVALITRDSDSERVEIARGVMTVNPDPATSSADPRTTARKTLDAIEAVIEGRASKDQESYSIAGRSLTRMSVEDLLSLRDSYRVEVRREEQADKIKNGAGINNQIYVRMR